MRRVRNSLSPEYRCARMAEESTFTARPGEVVFSASHPDAIGVIVCHSYWSPHASGTGLKANIYLLLLDLNTSAIIPSKVNISVIAIVGHVAGWLDSNTRETTMAAMPQK